ncbi:MAG: helical backbone metal receptor [Kiritimatiellia bacterium]
MKTFFIPFQHGTQLSEVANESRFSLTCITCALLLTAGCRPCKPHIDDSKDAVRIVSTSPALTEIVCAVGAAEMLVGRTDVCDYPPEIRSIPIIGKFAMPNIEKVLVLRPTYMLESFLVNPIQRRTLEHSGVQVEHIGCARIADIPAATRRIGELTRHETQAERIALSLENSLRKLQQIRGKTKYPPRTLILLDHLTPVTCGTNTFISEMVSLAGGYNVATTLKKEYDNVSLEWIIKLKPELILCFYEIDGDPARHFCKRTGWKDIPAVKNGRIRVPQNLDLICRPGPRILEGIEALRRCIDGAGNNWVHAEHEHTGHREEKRLP